VLTSFLASHYFTSSICKIRFFTFINVYFCLSCCQRTGVIFYLPAKFWVICLKLSYCRENWS